MSLILQNLYGLDIEVNRPFGESTLMRAHTRRTLKHRHHTVNRTVRVIRQLCAERARLAEEVKQLSAAMRIYKVLAQRAA
jgi:hypothetical protein